MLRRRSLVAWTAFAAWAPRAAGAQEAGWAQVVERANQQGRVNLLHNTPPPAGDIWLAEFSKAFPKISVAATRIGSAGLAQRFESETAAGASQTDVVLTLWDDTMETWRANGWLRTFVPPSAAAFPAQYRRYDQVYTVQLVRSAIVSNKSRVREADAPKEWADLFNPKWKDKIGMDPPWRSTAVQEMLAVWEQLGLADAAGRMKENGVRFFNGSAGVVQALIRGDVQVAGVIDPAVVSALEDGAPLRVTYPASAVPAVPTVLMLPSKSPNPDAGAVFMDWAMSAAGQQSMADICGASVTRPGVRPPKLVPGVDGQRIVLSQDVLSPAKQTEIVNRWRSVFGLQ